MEKKCENCKWYEPFYGVCFKPGKTIGEDCSEYRIIDEIKIKLPEEEYIHVEENGRIVTYTTMRQKCMHTIGMDHHKNGSLYTRHGKKYYRPYRNYFYGNDGDLNMLVAAGYMDFAEECVRGKYERTYWFNRDGLDWLGEQLGIHIHDEKG